MVIDNNSNLRVKTLPLNFFKPYKKLLLFQQPHFPQPREDKVVDLISSDDEQIKEDSINVKNQVDVPFSETKIWNGSGQQPF